MKDCFARIRYILTAISLSEQLSENWVWYCQKLLGSTLSMEAGFYVRFSPIFYFCPLKGVRKFAHLCLLFFLMLQLERLRIMQ